MTGPHRTRGRPRPAGLAERARGTWRVAVADGSMRPAIEPGDWLLVDPTLRRWPPAGTIVVVREPGSGLLVLKRVVAGPGEHVEIEQGRLHLADDEAWLGSDATDGELEAAGHGPAIDSRRYGPVPVTALVGRAWFRYGPPGRIGRLTRRPPGLSR